jgi:acyl carrier protein
MADCPYPFTGPAISRHAIPHRHRPAHPPSTCVVSAFVARSHDSGLLGDTSAMMQELKSFIFEELVFIEDPETFSSTDSLLEAGLDSMGIMRLVLFVEERFGVSLPDNELAPENMENLQRLEAWIKRHQQAN